MFLDLIINRADIEVDKQNHTIHLHHLSPYQGAPMVNVEVPKGIDILHLLNLNISINETQETASNWTVRIAPNTTEYFTLIKAFDVRFLLYNPPFLII